MFASLYTPGFVRSFLFVTGTGSRLAYVHSYDFFSTTDHRLQIYLNLNNCVFSIKQSKKHNPVSICSVLFIHMYTVKEKDKLQSYTGRTNLHRRIIFDKVYLRSYI